jgi:hypothetical protein
MFLQAELLPTKEQTNPLELKNVVLIIGYTVLMIRKGQIQNASIARVMGRHYASPRKMKHGAWSLQPPNCRITIYHL